MTRCRKMVGGGAVSFECSIEGSGHEGPCATPEVQTSMISREKWNEARLHPRTELDHYQAPAQTFPIEQRYPHPDQSVDCLLCTERPRAKDLANHLRQAHSSARIGSTDQPLPTPTADPVGMHDLLIGHITARKDMGLNKYNTLLQTFNGRDGLRDAFEELLDLLVYLQQLMIERVEMADLLEEAVISIAEVSQAGWERDKVETVLGWLRDSK